MSDELKAALKLWGVRALAALLAALLGAVGGNQMAPTKTQTVEVPVLTPAPFADDLSTPLNYEGCRYHGHEGVENVEANGRAFPGKDIRYFIDYSTVGQLRPALSNDAIATSIRQAWNWWSEGLDINPQEVTDPAQAHYLLSFNRSVFGTVDGSLGVLAACELGDGTTRPKRLIFDAAERWIAGPPANGGISLPTVACHELGHGLGLGHDDPTAPAVMRPTYTSAIPREQARDVQRLVGLGYAPRAKVPAGPVDVLSFPVQAKTDDVVDALKKAGFTVTKP